MGFSTPSYGLNDLFERVDRGDIQLPDFQREFLWTVDGVRSLILTVLRSFPVGCFMALDTRGAQPRFRARPLSGAPDTGAEPGLLLLDGQQRLTTLYHALRGDGFVEAIDYRGRNVRRRFYVDVERAVSGDVIPDEAVFAVDERGHIRSHFAPAELTPTAIAVSDLLEQKVTDRLFDLVAGDDEGTVSAVKDFFSSVVRPLSAYEIPIIRLDRHTASSGVGSVFAQANSAGQQMDALDLLTAVFSSEDPNFGLREHWQDIQAQWREYPALQGVDSTDFLTAVALLTTSRAGRAAGNREDILRLSLADYKRSAEHIAVTMKEVGEFLLQRGIVEASSVPFTAQLVPLSVMLARASDYTDVLAHVSAWDKLDRWFWAGAIGELYSTSAAVNRMAYDVDQVVEWLINDEAPLPATVRDAAVDIERVEHAAPTTGLHKAIMALLRARGARDWRTGEQFDRWKWAELRPVVSQIFTAKYCLRNHIDPALAQSALNYTPMGARTATMVDDHGPLRYLPRIESKSLMNDAEFDAVLATHFVDPHLLYAGDAEGFFANRSKQFEQMLTNVLEGNSVR